MIKSKYPVLKPVPHNSRGLMEALWDELDLLRQGKSTVARANTVIKLAQSVCVLARLDHEGVTVDPKALPIKN